MWRLVDAPDGRHPLARYPVRACPCADRGVGGVGVWLRLDIDATARSITPKARRKRPATWKKTFGHHLLLVFQDRPEIAGGEVLAGLLRALRRHITKGPGSRAAGIAMAYKLIEAAQSRWRAVNAPHLIALVRAGARFENGKLVERPTRRP